MKNHNRRANSHFPSHTSTKYSFISYGSMKGSMLQLTNFFVDFKTKQDCPPFQAGSCRIKFKLDRKERFARVCAAHVWSPAYQGSCIDPPHQFLPLDLTWEVPFLRLSAPIRLLEIDKPPKIYMNLSSPLNRRPLNQAITVVYTRC